MKAALEKRIEKLARLFDKARKKLFPNGSTCHLLEQDGLSAPYKVTAVIESGWLPLDERGRDAPELLIATTDENFGEKVSRITHYAINRNIFRVVSGETIEPQGTEPYWRFFGGNTHERFQL